MKLNPVIIVRLIGVALIIFGGSSFSVTFSQEVEAPQLRSRAEQVAARRNLEKTFPEVVRALRTLRLPADKMIEAEGKLRRSEAATRAAREELQSLEDETARQGYGDARSERANELRASLQQSTDQLHSEIKSLLTPQQRDHFDQRVQKLNRHNSSKQKNR